MHEPFALVVGIGGRSDNKSDLLMLVRSSRGPIHPPQTRTPTTAAYASCLTTHVIDSWQKILKLERHGQPGRERPARGCKASADTALNRRVTAARRYRAVSACLTWTEIFLPTSTSPNRPSGPKSNSGSRMLPGSGASTCL